MVLHHVLLQGPSLTCPMWVTCMTGQPGLLPILLLRVGWSHQRGFDFTQGARIHHVWGSQWHRRPETHEGQPGQAVTGAAQVGRGMQWTEG